MAQQVKGLVLSAWQGFDLLPGQWVNKDPVLPQLWCRLQLQLGFDSLLVIPIGSAPPGVAFLLHQLCFLVSSKFSWTGKKGVWAQLVMTFLWFLQFLTRLTERFVLGVDMFVETLWKVWAELLEVLGLDGRCGGDGHSFEGSYILELLRLQKRDPQGLVQEKKGRH